jgi:mgtE-like transporter
LKESGPSRRFYDSIPVQTLIALSFNNISLLAGGLISLLTPQFQAAPWILALFPPILTIRGGIGGIFSGNLATMLHLGLIKPRIRGNTDVYKHLVNASIVITIIDTLAMSLFAFIFNLALGRATINQVYVFAVVPPIACVMALSLSIPLTSVIAILAFRRGLDPDVLVYPILASVNDILVTATFVATTLLVLSGGLFVHLLTGLFFAILIFASLLIYRNRQVKFFYQTIREGTAVVILSSIFGSVNGSILSSVSVRLQEHPGVVVLYPALTNALGNIGSIVGSTKTTSLALGDMLSFADELRNAAQSIFRIEVVAFAMHAVFGVLTYLIVRPTTQSVNLMTLIGVALFTNLISFLLISILSIATAQQAFRRGLNPDNMVIPLITTVSDTVATLTTIYSLTILRTLGIV